MSNFLKLILLRYLPRLAKKAFQVKRLKEDASYWSSFEAPRKTDAGGTKSSSQPSLLIVLPPDDEEPTPFESATGNYNYEIFRSSQERYGEYAIQVFGPIQSTDWVIECRKISVRVKRDEITHLLFYIESNEHRSGLWRWDILAGELTRSGSNVTAIGFLTDGTYELHQIQCSRFQDVYPQSLFIQIDVVPSFKYVRPGRLVGPTFLPISLESMARIEGHILDTEVDAGYELSFIGKLYGYRKKIIKTLLNKGLEVAINPQIAKGSINKASYLDYMGALSRSKYTINFARANGTRQKQLKSRILESALVGSIPVTDDNGLTDRMLSKGIPFISFKRPLEIAEILAGSSSTEAPRLEDLRRPVMPTGDVSRLACSHFWETLEEGLTGAGLPSLGPLSETP